MKALCAICVLGLLAAFGCETLAGAGEARLGAELGSDATLGDALVTTGQALAGMLGPPWSVLVMAGLGVGGWLLGKRKAAKK